jgi:hydrogenase expression/formation protein HypD
MKHVDEFRRFEIAERLVERILTRASSRWTVMDVCGGQTHAIVKYGIDERLRDSIDFVHGPGCPVCITPLETLDRAHAIASLPDVVLASFGDMLRVPGSMTELLSLRARGADVRVVTAPLDAVRIASNEPKRRVVFFSVGFETTAPATALAVQCAEQLGLTNLSFLASHALVPPALDALLSDPRCTVDGLLGPGHACAVTGYEPYESLSERHAIPIVVTGFEPLDILQGLAILVDRLEDGKAGVENQYERSVTREGNRVAKAMVDEVFRIDDRTFLGLGALPGAGLYMRDTHNRHDAEKLYDVALPIVREPSPCLASLVLTGQKRPDECPAFSTACTPESPLGAPMVSAEGACAAHYCRRHVAPDTGGRGEA